jgi:hypothetical protein
VLGRYWPANTFEIWGFRQPILPLGEEKILFVQYLK